MKYICLLYNEDAKLDAMSEAEWDALTGETAACNEELRRRGHLIAAQVLERARAATTVRVRNGRLFATEGPAAGAPEQLRGFVLIDARDLNEAIQVASKMPGARVGSIEVRPIPDVDRKDR
ncbi:MAG TPA: YciI family protein [bacterium]|nr:YciI family protein [bacterium]